MVHIPVAINVAVDPETVQTAGVLEANSTGRPELAVAVSVSGEAPSVWLEIALKVMIWFFKRKLLLLHPFMTIAIAKAITFINLRLGRKCSIAVFSWVSWMIMNNEVLLVIQIVFLDSLVEVLVCG